MLIGMEFILEVLETAIATAYVKGEIPSSVILVGPSGAGKSKALLIYNDVRIPTVHMTDDLTSAGIDSIVTSDPESKKAHILCPDFNVPLTHRDSVANLMAAKLMTLMSDGVCRIDDGRNQKEVKHRQVGILTAMTSPVYVSRSKKWDMLGFKRRFIPIFFEYSAKTEAEVQSAIRRGKSTAITIRKNPLPKNITSRPVKINSREGHALENFSVKLSSNLSYHPAREKKTGKLISIPGGNFLPYSPHNLLRTMASGHAILKNRNAVNQSDVDFVAEMIDFCKYGHPVSI